MIALRRWQARRAAWVKRLAAIGAPALPLPASNLINHLCQLAWSERTLLLGAGDPLLWLAIVVGHEATGGPYRLTGVAANDAGADCRAVIRGLPVVAGELNVVVDNYRFTGEHELDLLIVDLRRWRRPLRPGWIAAATTVILYGADRSPRRVQPIMAAARRRKLAVAAIPWGDGVIMIGNPRAANRRLATK